jgi:hypothetical protein
MGVFSSRATLWSFARRPQARNARESAEASGAIRGGLRRLYIGRGSVSLGCAKCCNRSDHGRWLSGTPELSFPNIEVAPADRAVEVGVAVGLGGVCFAKASLPSQEVGSVDDAVAVEIGDRRRRGEQTEVVDDPLHHRVTSRCGSNRLERECQHYDLRA